MPTIPVEESAMRARLGLIITVGALAAGALSPSAAALDPGASLDQSQSTVEGCGQFPTGFTIGQVFTAGTTGRLSDLLLTLGNSAGATDLLRAQLTRVDGAGFPDLTAVLGEVILESSDIPTPGPAPVELRFGNPALAAGTRYAVVVSTADSVGYEICGAGSADFYAGGQAWGSMDGGASWSDIGGDAGFATYMLPPRVTRLGYCLAGRFLDLVAGQPDADSTYAGAVMAIFVRGKGITCDPPPAGFTQQGRTSDKESVGAGTYMLYAAVG